MRIRSRTAWPRRSPPTTADRGSPRPLQWWIETGLLSRLVRKGLGRLDFAGALDGHALLAICGSGRPGSTLLRAELAGYDPRFGRANGRLGEDYLLLCETYDIPMPDEVEVRVYGILADNRYSRERVIVELDGLDNHTRPGQTHRDHLNDLILRGHGETVLRYDWPLVHDDPWRVRTDVRACHC